MTKLCYKLKRNQSYLTVSELFYLWPELDDSQPVWCTYTIVFKGNCTLQQQDSVDIGQSETLNTPQLDSNFTEFREVRGQ